MYLNDGTISGDYSRELDGAVAGIKTSEARRVEYMNMLMRDMEIREEGREEGRTEGRAEGRAEGKAEGREAERLDGVRRAVRKLGVSLRQAMDFMDIPASGRNRFIEQMEATPS